MKRNPFFTYLFSLCPGGGQMFQGYMKRGLSLTLLFVVFIVLAAIFIPPLVALSAVVYMYSFFDSINLRAQIVAYYNGTGTPLPGDDFLFHLNSLNFEGFNGKPRLIGWGLVVLGAASLYKTVLQPLLISILDLLPRSPLSIMLHRITYSVPSIALGVLFVIAGLWLIRGSKTPEDDFPTYGGDNHDN